MNPKKEVARPRTAARLHTPLFSVARSALASAQRFALTLFRSIAPQQLLRHRAISTRSPPQMPAVHSHRATRQVHA
jgi:hypothetical protein